MKKKLGYLLVAVVLLISAVLPMAIALAEETEPISAKKVVVLVDKSMSMQYDCSHPYHSYYSHASGATLQSKIAGTGNMQHFHYNLDANSAIASGTKLTNPHVTAYKCDSRYDKARQIATQLVTDIFAANSNNSVAFMTFNTTLNQTALPAFSTTAEAANTALSSVLSYPAYNGSGLGTNLKATLDALNNLVTSSNVDTVVIISDGQGSSNDLGSVVTSAYNTATYNNTAYDPSTSASAIKAKGIDILAIGVGATTQAQAANLTRNYNAVKGITSPVGFLANYATLKAISGESNFGAATVNTYRSGTLSTFKSGSCTIKAETPVNIKNYFGVPYSPSITKDLDEEKSVAFGTELKLEVGASVTKGSLSYQWYKDNAAISGATSAVYSVNSAELTDAGAYHCVITSSNGAVGTLTATSKTCAVTVRKADQPVFTTDLAAEKAVKLLTSFTLTVEAKADYSDKLEYQWYKDGAEISGATSASYTVDSAEEEDAGSYSVKVKNTYGTSSAEATSEVCAVSVTENADIPVIADQPKGVSVGAEDTSFTLSVTATAAEGGVISYQWYKDGAAIDGAIAAEYSVTTPDPETDAGKYTVKVTNAVGGKTYITTSAAAEVSFDDYYDVLILVDTSISMRNDCEDPDHSYVSASVRDSNGLAADSIYKHYIVSKDEDGNVKIDASAIVNPTESCGEVHCKRRAFSR